VQNVSEENPLPKKRLLVTDVDPQVRDSLSEAFGSQFDVLATPSIEEAIREATINQPSCILLDTAMPQMGAAMLCKILRSMPETEMIPVVLMGLQPRNTSLQAVKHMEPFDYIEKPFSIDQVSRLSNAPSSELPWNAEDQNACC
jgi:CheY-like chemotaxis protein